MTLAAIWLSVALLQRAIDYRADKVSMTVRCGGIVVVGVSEGLVVVAMQR